VEGLEALERELARLRESVLEGDEEAVHALFSRGASGRK
jgi:hypothetical protein